MESEEFCYWLQGFFDLTDQSKPLTKKQTEIIKAHLNTVFTEEKALQNLFKKPLEPFPTGRFNLPFSDPALEAVKPYYCNSNNEPRKVC